MSIKRTLYRLKHGWHACAWERALAAAEAMTGDELLAYNWQRRKALVQHCGEQVPYYRRVFREIGFDHRDLRTEKDFLQLPLLDRETVRSESRDLVALSARHKKLTPTSTGGTTGVPVTVFSDPSVPLATFSWRMLNWWDVDVSDNSGYLYRAVPVGLGRTVADVLSYPTQRAYISASSMTAAETKAFVQRLDRIQPAYLVGYVGAIDALAAFLRNEDKRVPYLKAVWTTAAPMPLGMRKDLDSVFGCPVYSQYGSVETYTMGADCPVRQGLHVFSDIRHVELVRTNMVSGAKELGEVIVTDLTNYVFPLLRYRTGDTSRAINTPCPCGRAFPLIEYVQGRVSDTIYLSDGTPVPGEFWTTIFDDYTDSIRSFRVHQNTDRTIDITYEGAGPASASAAAAVLRTLSSKLGSAASIRISQGFGASNDRGKLRFITSAVSSG